MNITELIGDLKYYGTHVAEGAKATAMLNAADALKAQQVCIEQMREALTEVVDADECQDADGWLCFELSAEAYHRADAALSIQCNQDALHEARALECERLADAEGVEEGHREWLREEAAAHRARKEGK